MAKFWTKKGPKMAEKFFCHDPNLLYLVLNHKLGLKNKNCQTNIGSLEKNWSKMMKNLNLSPQAMYL